MINDELLIELKEPEAKVVFPCLIPSFYIKGNGLYFGKDLLLTLNQQELLFLMCCDGEIDFETINEKTNDAGTYRSYFDSFLIDLPERRQEVKKAAEILIISPHSYEAYISMASSLKKWSDLGNNIQFISCFSMQTSLRKELKIDSPIALSQLRKDEAEICARLCQINNHYLNFPDHQYAKAHLFDKDFVENFKKNSSAIRQSLFHKISRIKPNTIYFPAGLSGNKDGHLIHELLLDFYKKSIFPDTSFYMYEDFPFSLHYNAIDDLKISLEDKFVHSQDVFETINEYSSIKLDAYRVFCSLFSPQDRQMVDSLTRRNTILAAGKKDQKLDHFLKLGMRK